MIQQALQNVQFKDIVKWGMAALLPALLGTSGWLAIMVLDHQTRLTRLEAISEAASDDLDTLQVKMDAMLQAIHSIDKKLSRLEGRTQ